MFDKLDMNMVMSVLSKMDKKDLEMGIAQANKILQNKKAEEVMKDLQNK